MIGVWLPLLHVETGAILQSSCYISTYLSAIHRLPQYQSEKKCASWRNSREEANKIIIRTEKARAKQISEKSRETKSTRENQQSRSNPAAARRQADHCQTKNPGDIPGVEPGSNEQDHTHSSQGDNYKGSNCWPEPEQDGTQKQAEDNSNEI